MKSVDIVSDKRGNIFMAEDIITNESDILKVVKHPESRNIPDTLHTTLPDMTNEDETEPRLLLSCGHAIGICISYYQYLLMFSKSSASSILFFVNYPCKVIQLFFFLHYMHL